MITYEITSTGYRIFLDGTLWIIQEGEYAAVFPGETLEERAQAHVNSLTGVLTPQEEIAMLREQLAEQQAINDILTGGDGNGTNP